ncbi:MAG: Endolytic murein transglycosylase [Patescibacteria group bacterium]|nr:Endolytic murein transglycosylase [Patescibacteria group bacterium]
MDTVILTENYIENEHELNKTKMKQKKPFHFFKWLIALFAVVIGLAFLGALVVYGYYNREINSPVRYDTDSSLLKISIEKGMSVSAISELLYEEKLITRPEILKAYLYLNPDKSVQAGYYEIDLSELTLVQLVEKLQDGSFERKLTFLEGWRIEEYVEYLRKTMGDDFADKFASSSFIKEGYLFPDTYIIDSNLEPENLASMMRNTFEKRFSSNLKAQATAKNLTEEEAVILASILEREMNHKADRRIVAGILVKRYRENWALQADATLQYAKGNKKDWWPIVTRDDYQNLDSQYNTYTNKGLPPAPIANPGLDALESVVEYEDSEYWFYISGNNGKTYFAKTLEEHNQNVETYIR